MHRYIFLWYNVRQNMPFDRHKLHYRLLLGTSAVLRVLPRRVALTLAWLLHFPALFILAPRVREARRRIATIVSDQKTVKRAARISLRNTLFNAVEMMSVGKFKLDYLNSIAKGLPEAVAKLRALSEESGGRGIVITLPHCGNWDLAGSMCCLSGLPIFSVAGKQRNPYINDWINKSRGGHGMTILERGDSAIMQIIRRLKSGEMFAILPDTRNFTPDLSVPFLGGDANVARGMAAFAWQAKVPVFPIVIRRVGWMKFDIKSFPEIAPDYSAQKEAEILRITRETLAIFDREIRATPEQWFWYNKRWVLEPVQQVS